MRATYDGALPGVEADDPRLMSRVLAAMLLCGGTGVLAAAAISPPTRANVAGLYVVGMVAVTLGAAALATARRARVWTAHALFAVGSSLICVGTFVSGAATGLYVLLLVWLAIFAATSFSLRAITAQIAWIMVASGVTLAVIAPSPGPPPGVRWVFGGALLTVAATIMGLLAAKRRASEARLRAEIQERERLQRELKHLADHDPLTGVANRRRLEHDLALELARARREGIPLCVVTLDLDDLKEHNDTYGHAAGDRLLRHVARTWSAALGKTDLLARTGGDEFVVLLPGSTLEMAERLIDRLREAVATTCNCSAGAAIWNGRESAADLQARADLAMYEAKSRARLSGAQATRTRGSQPAPAPRRIAPARVA